MQLALTLVAVAVLLPSLHAFNFDRQPEDDLLDTWLQEQMTGPGADTEEAFPSNVETDNMAYATPGHIEEDDFMTAFFENQDHAAFADDAVDESYGADRNVDAYLADFFGHSQDNVETQDNTETQDYKNYKNDYVVEEQAVPEGNAENRMDAYLSNFFDEDEEPQPEEPAVESKYYGRVASVNEDGDAAAENYIDSFFNNDRETTSQDAPNYGVFAKVEEDDEDDDEDDGYMQDEDEDEDDDLRAWNMAMGYGTGETVEEDSDEDSILKAAFMDFPADDMFAYASVQEHQDPECEAWKKRMIAVQTKVNAEGRKIQAELVAEDKSMKEYKKQLNVSCNLNCETICVPGEVGEECVRKENGTCVETEPKIDECARRMPDPACSAKEAECKAKQKGPAEKMMHMEKEKMAEKDKMDKLNSELQKVAESLPPKCENMPEPPKAAAPKK